MGSKQFHVKNMEIEIRGLEGLEEGAKQFAAALRTGKVYAFYGEMGAGKTTLIAEICRVLGVEDDVSSPTFSIVNEYDTASGEKLYHFDCYRLDSEEEAMDVGAEDYFYSGNTCFVEWPEKIEGILPGDVIDVHITVLPDGSRRVRF